MSKRRELVPVAPSQPPRGLELIRSSAKFYPNGAGGTRPPIQLSYQVRGALDNPASTRAFSSPVGKIAGPCHHHGVLIFANSAWIGACRNRVVWNSDGGRWDTRSNL